MYKTISMSLRFLIAFLLLMTLMTLMSENTIESKILDENKQQTKLLSSIVDGLKEPAASEPIIEEALTEEELFNQYIRDICATYNNVPDPELVSSIVYYESTYNPNEVTGSYVGLMQISKRWHADRMQRLGVTDLSDPYSNILVGVDYLSELFSQYKDPKLVLMLYSGNHKTAIERYNRGETTPYVDKVLSRYREQVAMN